MWTKWRWFCQRLLLLLIIIIETNLFSFINWAYEFVSIKLLLKIQFFLLNAWYLSSRVLFMLWSSSTWFLMFILIIYLNFIWIQLVKFDNFTIIIALNIWNVIIMIFKRFSANFTIWSHYVLFRIRFRFLPILSRRFHFFKVNSTFFAIKEKKFIIIDFKFQFVKKPY